MGTVVTLNCLAALGADYMCRICAHNAKIISNNSTIVTMAQI